MPSSQRGGASQPLQFATQRPGGRSSPPDARHGSMDTALISDLPAELPESAVVVTSGTGLRRDPHRVARHGWTSPLTTGRTQNNLSRAASGGIPDNRAGAQIGGYTRPGSDQ